MVSKKIITRYIKLRSYFYAFFLRLTGVKIGKGFLIYGGWKIYNNQRLEIGENVFINDNFWCNAKGNVTIQDGVLIGPNVVIHSSNHNFADQHKHIRKQGHTDKPVLIRSNVWLGAGVIILPGVEICERVVVAAGSVVTKNIDVSGVYGGVPAKFIKNI
ncbi:acyltransferase [Shewanella algae]|uniref:acyltransferase n=1 Tax=Shewanella algae TaxID=38313 RepID=UPI0011A4080C|nr:acyltransferase [Shewanella algae]